MENGNGHISTRGIEHAVEHFSKAVDLARAERSPTFFMPALKYLSASSITSEPLRCVALRFVRRGQLTVGLAPTRVRPCWARNEKRTPGVPFCCAWAWAWLGSASAALYAERDLVRDRRDTRHALRHFFGLADLRAVRHRGRHGDCAATRAHVHVRHVEALRFRP